MKAFFPREGTMLDILANKSKTASLQLRSSDDLIAQRAKGLKRLNPRTLAFSKLKGNNVTQLFISFICANE